MSAASETPLLEQIQAKPAEVENYLELAKLFISQQQADLARC